jgi:hypothetical protein
MRQRIHDPTGAWLGYAWRRFATFVEEAHANGKVLLDVMMIEYGESEILEIIRARGSPRGLARRLNRRQQQCDQNANDRNDDQQFNQRKAFPANANTLSHDCLFPSPSGDSLRGTSLIDAL